MYEKEIIGAVLTHKEKMLSVKAIIEKKERKEMSFEDFFELILDAKIAEVVHGLISIRNLLSDKDGG